MEPSNFTEFGSDTVTGSLRHRRPAGGGTFLLVNFVRDPCANGAGKGRMSWYGSDVKDLVRPLCPSSVEVVKSARNDFPS